MDIITRFWSWFLRLPPRSKDIIYMEKTLEDLKKGPHIGQMVGDHDQRIQFLEREVSRLKKLTPRQKTT